MKRTACLAALVLFSLCGTALAGAPADLVRTFYTPVGFEPDPALRHLFVDPAKSVFERNDKLTNGGEEIGCIDFVLAIDAQDLDQAEIDRTLKLTEQIAGDTAHVTARFNLFAGGDGAPREIVWILKQVGGAWKISDIASRSSRWRLGEFDCTVN